MAGFQASVMAPLGAAPAVVAPSAGNCASTAAPPASMSLRVSAIGLTGLLLSYPMTSSLLDPRLPGGHCDSIATEPGAATAPAAACDRSKSAGLWSCLLPSDRHLALQHEPIEIAALLHVVVGVGLVHDAAVVPHHPVAVAPLVAVLVLLLRGVPHQVADQRQRILILHEIGRAH